MASLPDIAQAALNHAANVQLICPTPAKGSPAEWLWPAAISGVTALIVLIVSSLVSADLHRKRIEADFYFAERKVALDQDHAIWKRRVEIAEQTLTLFYEAKAALQWARGSYHNGGEGQSRASAEGETPDLKRRRDSYYVPIERLNNAADTFAKAQSARYLFIAYFGITAADPFLGLISVHNQIQSAANILIQMAPTEDIAPQESFVPLRRKLGWGERPDPLDEELDVATRQIEGICRSFLVPANVG